MNVDSPRDTVTIVELDAVPTVVVRVSDYPMAEMSVLFDTTFSALFPALGAAGIEPVGVPFSLHTRMPTDTCDMEVGVPVSAPLPEPITVGEVALINSEQPAGRAATISYHGPYEGLGGAWGAFMGAVVEQGVRPAFPFWEVYVTDPSTSTPDALRTDLWTSVTDA